MGPCVPNALVRACAPTLVTPCAFLQPYNIQICFRSLEHQYPDICACTCPCPCPAHLAAPVAPAISPHPRAILALSSLCSYSPLLTSLTCAVLCLHQVPAVPRGLTLCVTCASSWRGPGMIGRPREGRTLMVSLADVAQ